MVSPASTLENGHQHAGKRSGVRAGTHTSHARHFEYLVQTIENGRETPKGDRAARVGGINSKRQAAAYCSVSSRDWMSTKTAWWVANRDRWKVFQQKRRAAAEAWDPNGRVRALKRGSHATLRSSPAPLAGQPNKAWRAVWVLCAPPTQDTRPYTLPVEGRLVRQWNFQTC